MAVSADGCVADVAMFDAAKVRDVGTFEDPHHYAEGIPYVIVNGTPVVDGGRVHVGAAGKGVASRSTTRSSDYSSLAARTPDPPTQRAAPEGSSREVRRLRALRRSRGMSADRAD